MDQQDSLGKAIDRGQIRPGTCDRGREPEGPDRPHAIGVDHERSTPDRTTMRTTLLLLALCAAVLLTACRKEEETACPSPDIAPAPLSISAFSHLDSGNYWVYDRHRVDSMDVADPTYYRRDSLFVTGDTVLDGHTWSVVRLASNGVVSGMIEYWRDSADYLLGRYGEVLFAAANLGQVIWVDSIPAPSTVSIHYSVGSALVPVSVPAGNFQSYVITGTCYSYGAFPVIPAWKYPRDYWVEGIGRVKWYDYFAMGTTGYRYQLLDYHVQ
jgi:hypothetical protein